MTVPEQYLGVWQRKQLESPAGIDNTTQVYWLQTPSLHADIRIPADRPDFSGKASLQDFSLTELKQLARQLGFAGVTRVVDDTCQWIRQLDYQPARTDLDIGRMQFNDNHLIESGIARDYTEIWEKLPDSQGATFALRFTEKNTTRSPEQSQAGILVVSGDYFIFVRDRSHPLPHATSLTALLDDTSYTHPQLIAMLDFEISFGRLTQGSLPWEIQLSTLPFREGTPLFTTSDWAEISQTKAEYIQDVQTVNGIISRHWFIT
ncbi:hypothetical protein [Sulfuriferula nivalis]|uniref:Uncharacterized protein n=1 Tax=Sulfuriferula nivalis TaxID=2675298 RepID=A0A809S961_9PROT|nr:hypothetical protein [Sulfuriferula nivalis]BBP00692.1 hypothetical protein SFSGTM_14000 [Sulfuriferula nivalis]